MSANAYDWLGKGIYFWEYVPNRALAWAKQRYRLQDTDLAVVGVTLKLGYCLTLLDTGKAIELSSAYQRLIREERGQRLRNTERGAHYLDREVIDTYCNVVSEQTN